MSEKSHISIARQLIHEAEGDILKAYKCPAGKWTIGRGRNLEDRGITQAESDFLLANDVAEANAVCAGEFDFFRRLNDPRKAVMMDMYHNMGLTRLLGFKKMLKAIQLGQFDDAAKELKDSRYFRQVGQRGRRNFMMMKFGKFVVISESEKYFRSKK